MPTNEANDSFPMMSLRMPTKQNVRFGDTKIVSFFAVSNIHHWIFLTLYEMLQGQNFSLGLSHMKRYVNMYLKGMSKYPFRMVVCMLLMFVVDMWNQTSAKQQCQHFFLSLWKFLYPGIETIFFVNRKVWKSFTSDRVNVNEIVLLFWCCFAKFSISMLV